MRMSKEAMAAHHEEIVAAAAKMLRERGIEGTSVADLMQAAGLTHGGFYRHFESKDALVAEAAQSIFEDRLKSLEAKSQSNGATETVEDYITRYLTRQHVSRPGMGCPIAALGAEVGRSSAEVQSVYADGIEALLAALQPGFSGTPAERRAGAMRQLSMLVGAVVIARSVGNDKIGDEVLSACRHTSPGPAQRKR